MRKYDVEALVDALRSVVRGAQAYVVDRRPARIAELSLEFDCELREVRPKDGPDADRLVIVFHAAEVLRRKNRHRVKVTIFGRDALRTEVRRDGTLIEDIGPDGES